MTLSAPSSSGNIVDNAPVVFSISGETGGIRDVKLVFTYLSGYYTANVGKKDSVKLVSNSSAQSFSFNPSKITSSALFSANTGNLVDGVYSVYANYTRVATGAIVRSNTANAVTFDTGALPHTMTSPAANTTVGGTFLYEDIIPESFAAGSKQLTFQSTSTGNSTVVTLTNGVRNSRFNFNTSSIVTSGVSTTTSNTIPDGLYLLSLSYRDLANHTGTLSRYVKFDSKTLPPVIHSPLNGTKQNSRLNLLTNIPEGILVGSAEILFKPSAGSVESYYPANPVAGLNSFALDLKNLSPGNVGSPRSLADGTYDIIFRYRDNLYNIASSDTLSNFILDNTTLPPTLVSPNSSQVLRSGDLLNLNFVLPEKPLAGSVKLNLLDGTTIYPIVLNASNAGTISTTIDPLNVNGSAGVLSSFSNSIKSGNYTLNISYQDSLANPAAVSASTSLLIDRETLAMNNVSVSDTSTIDGLVDIVFNLPEVALSNSAKLQFNGCDQISMKLTTSGIGSQTFRVNGNNLLRTNRITESTQSTIPIGHYAVIISYKDTLGNTKSESIKPDLFIRGVILPPIVTTRRITPICNDVIAELNKSITSDTTGLTVRFYSDSTLVNTAQRQVSVPGTYFVKVTNAYDLESMAQFVVDPFTICPEGLNKAGTKTRNRIKYVDKNGMIGKFRTVNKNGVKITIPR